MSTDPIIERARLAYVALMGREPAEPDRSGILNELAAFVTHEELDEFARVGLESFQTAQNREGIGGTLRVDHRDFLWDGTESILICAAAERRSMWLKHIVRHSDVERPIVHMIDLYRDTRGLRTYG